MTEKRIHPMSPEAIAARRDRMQGLRDAAESAWEAGDHEGDPHEREYFIRGFIAAVNTASYLSPQIESQITDILKKQ